MTQTLTKVGFAGGTFVSGIVQLRDMHPGATLKELRPAAKRANIEAVLYWHRRYLPQHFENSAKTIYSYEPRSKQYMKRKARRFGHQRPLVYTGELRANAVRQIRPSGTSKGARGLMPGTQVANFGSRRNMPPMRDEMTRTIRSERRAMARHHEQTVADQLRRIRGVTRRKV